jgi:low affinity Fe/Cu permease
MIDKLKAKWAAMRPPKPERVSDPPGVIPESLVKSAELASWMAFAALVYFLWLYTLDIAKDRAAALQLENVGPFMGLGLDFWFPYIGGFALVAIGIPYVAKIAIPVFMSLSWRGQAWPKAWALVIALSVSLVIIAGTFAVQGDALMERDRGSAVAVEEVQQNRAALEARIAARTADLDRLTAPADDTPNMQQMAARAGETAWAERVAVAQAQGSSQALSIERALSDARAADRIRADIEALRVELATAPTEAAVSATVSAGSGAVIGDLMSWVETYRAILLSLVMDIVCLMMPWIALRLRQARDQQLAGLEAPAVEPAPIADEGHMLPDLRGQDAPEPEVDAYFEDLAAKRSEAARKGWNKRKMRVQTREGGAFETAGVVEERSQQSPSDERVVRAPEVAPAPMPEPSVEGPELVPELTEEEELLALYGEDAVLLPDGEGVMVDDTAAMDKAQKNAPTENREGV